MSENSAAVAEPVTRPSRLEQDRFVDRLVERLGGAASTNAVYGAPIDRGGVTVIPVAQVRWGFGGGAGHGLGNQGERQGEGHGEGGGGGMIVSPLGYIEISDGEAEFSRIFDPMALLFAAPVILALGIALRLTLGALLSPRTHSSHGIQAPQLPRVHLPLPNPLHSHSGSSR